MRKLIRQYEEKNRIIEEIQKNLRMVHLRSPRQQHKNNNKTRLTSISFKLDLPTINVRHEYSPRSSNGSPEKKQVSLTTREPPEQKPIKKDNKPWIQTISFRNQHQNQTPTKPVLLINHRTTLRNFMKSTFRSQNQSGDKSIDEGHREIFLSTSKYLLTKQDSKLFKDQRERSERNEESQEEQSPKMPDKKQRKKKKSIRLEQEQKEQEQQQAHIRHSQEIIEQIMSTQMQKKQKSPRLEAQINFNSLNTTVLVPNRYWRSRKKSSKNKRSCSPWNSEKEGQEIGEIWNANL